MSILAAVRQKIKERRARVLLCLQSGLTSRLWRLTGINTAENVSPEETMVLILGGAGGRGVHLRGYNGYLKKTDDFIKTHPELFGEECQSLCRRLLHRAFS